MDFANLFRYDYFNAKGFVDLKSFFYYNGKMNIIISFILAVLPVGILLRFFYKKDSLKPEPIGLIFKVFLWGLFGVFPTIFIELFIRGFKGFFSFSVIFFVGFEAFIVAGLVEEFVKLFIVKMTIYKDKNFDEVMDGIIYTITASLGFACLENILYVMGTSVTVAIIRGFTAVPMHAIMSGIMGFYIGKAKFSSSVQEKSLIRKGLMIAVILHGTYDFLLMILKYFPQLLYINLTLVVLMIIIAGKHLLNLIKRSKNIDFREGRV